MTGIDPAHVLVALRHDRSRRAPRTALAQLGTPGTVVVKKSYADAHKTKVGDTLTVTTPDARAAPR